MIPSFGNLLRGLGKTDPLRRDCVKGRHKVDSILLPAYSRNQGVHTSHHVNGASVNTHGGTTPLFAVWNRIQRRPLVSVRIVDSRVWKGSPSAIRGDRKPTQEIDLAVNSRNVRVIDLDRRRSN